jgi:hypothetical protein
MIYGKYIKVLCLGWTFHISNKNLIPGAEKYFISSRQVWGDPVSTVERLPESKTVEPTTQYSRINSTKSPVAGSLASLSWCHKSGEWTKSRARRSVCFHNQRHECCLISRLRTRDVTFPLLYTRCATCSSIGTILLSAYVYDWFLDVSEMHFLPPPVLEPLTVLPAVSHSTDCNAYTFVNCTIQRGVARFTLRPL